MKLQSRRQFLRDAAVLAGSATAASFLLSDRLAAAPADRRLNILLVFPDQLRADWSSLNAALPVRTPNLARLAADGLRIARAHCPSPLCAPSRACLSQGRAYGRTGVPDNRTNSPDGVTTFYQQLRDAGYQVAAVGKADLRKAAFDWGPDGRHQVDGHDYFREWGFTHGFDSEGKYDAILGMRRKHERDGSNPALLQPYTRMLARRDDGSLGAYREWFARWETATSAPQKYALTEPCRLADPAYNDNWVGMAAVDLLERQLPRGTPWFLQVNFPGPHDPEDITPAMANWYRTAAFPQPVNNDQLSPEQHVKIRRNYSAMVENIDRWLGELIKAVEARAETGNTLIVFSSDHGEMLGDHNRWAKRAPYEPSASVPLLIKGPGVRKNAVHHGPTTTLDLPATFLEAAGTGLTSWRDSASLWPVLRGEASAGRPHVISAFGSWQMVFDGRFKLIRGFDPADYRPQEKPPPDRTASNMPWLLFDLEADPSEVHNIADRRRDVVERLAPILLG